jgi:NlpC/P60 family putative phage cell wall peptidase
MTGRALDGGSGAVGAQVVVVARAWLGTPYRHQASCKGAGADCLGLVRGIWRELYGCEPAAVPVYTPGWSDGDRAERLLAAAGRHMVAVPTCLARPGDALVLRMVEGGVAKHIGILAVDRQGHDSFIHAYSGHGVVESPLTPAWRRRIAGAFRFPDRRP